MRLLTYQGLDISDFKTSFERFRTAVEHNDLKSAGPKKLRPGRYYRVKLDGASRLLLDFRRYQGEVVCTLL